MRRSSTDYVNKKQHQQHGEIYDGDKMINGLIWSIIAHFGFGSWARSRTSRWSVDSSAHHRSKTFTSRGAGDAFVCAHSLGDAFVQTPGGGGADITADWEWNQSSSTDQR